MNVFVIEYDYEGFEAESISLDKGRDLSERLSTLLQLDILYNDSFGNFGVAYLRKHQSGACDPDAVFGLLQSSDNALAAGQAAAFLWGRIYLVGDVAYVQSYLKFLRVQNGGSSAEMETIKFRIGENERVFEGRLHLTNR